MNRGFWHDVRLALAILLVIATYAVVLGILARG